MSDRKFPASFLFVVLLTPFLIQCASQQDIKTLDLRLRTMNNQLYNITRDVEEIRDKTGESAKKISLEQVQKRLANLDNNTDLLNSRIMEIQGQLDEKNNQFRNFQDSNEQFHDNVTSHIHEIRNDMAAMQESMEAASTRLETLEQNLKIAGDQIEALKKVQIQQAADRARTAAVLAEKAAEKARGKVVDSDTPKKITPAKTKVAKGEEKTTETKTAAKTQATDPGEKIYNQALEDFRDKRYKDAYIKFSEYIEKYPDGPMQANARYWLGDTLYKQNEYELAILEYQKVIADHPNHSKTPAALLKQGLSFEKLNDKDTARIVYTKLVDEYPDSDQVDMAKKRLKEL